MELWTCSRRIHFVSLFLKMWVNPQTYVTAQLFMDWILCWQRSWWTRAKKTGILSSSAKIFLGEVAHSKRLLDYLKNPWVHVIYGAPLGKTRIFFKLSKIYNSQSPVKTDEVKQSHTLNTPLFVVTPLVLSNEQILVFESILRNHSSRCCTTCPFAVKISVGPLYPFHDAHSLWWRLFCPSTPPYFNINVEMSSTNHVWDKGPIKNRKTSWKCLMKPKNAVENKDLDESETTWLWNKDIRH